MVEFGLAVNLGGSVLLPSVSGGQAHIGALYAIGQVPGNGISREPAD